MVLACSHPPAPCGPGNCAGCCDPFDNCFAGVSQGSCGVGGGACAACGTTEACRSGQCQSTRVPCGPATCRGCCDASGACVTGQSALQCGLPGAACAACPEGDVCNAGACVSLADAAVPPPIPLVGCVITAYQAPAKVGPGVFHLLIDTGSTITAVASTVCGAQCSDVSPLYADTGTDAKLAANTFYADGSSWVGEIYDDQVELVGGSQYAVPLGFVAITRQTGFFRDYQCDGNLTTTATNQGIVGLGNPDLLSPGTTAYIDQLADAGIPDVFAVQLCESGGRMWLGGFDPAAASAPPRYTPIVPSPFLSVQLTQVRVGGTVLAAADLSPAIVDTGTSFLGLPTDAILPLVRSLESDPAFGEVLLGYDAGFFLAGTCLPARGALAPADLDAVLPPLGLVFPTDGGTSFSLQALATHSYLTPVAQDGGIVYCVSVFDMGPGGGSVIGDTVMTGYLTLFDLGAQRIGFAPSQGCAPLPRPPPNGQRALVAPVSVPFRDPRHARR